MPYPAAPRYSGGKGGIASQKRTVKNKTNKRTRQTKEQDKQKNNTNKKEEEEEEEEEVPGFRFGAQSILAPKTYDPLPVTAEPNNS